MQFALFIFSFLTIVGAFSAWRKSPLYSLGSSLKLVGAFLLIVVVVVGTSPAIPDDHITDLPMMQQKIISHCPNASVHQSAP